jgi:flagellar motor switch protein FliN
MADESNFGEQSDSTLQSSLANLSAGIGSSEPVPPSPAPAPEERRAEAGVDLLLDVQMPLTVSFGRAQIRLKDLVSLTSGSLIPLDRALSEAVEVRVNNCVIARGEVVAVEGNYAVRILEIAKRTELEPRLAEVQA